MSAGYYGARLRAQGLVPFRKYNIHTYLHRYIHTHMTYIHYIWFGLFCLLVCVRGSGGARARARARHFSSWNYVQGVGWPFWQGCDHINMLGKMF